MDNENVSTLYGKAIFSKPNENVIETLVDLLDRARSGETLGIAVVAMHKNGMADWSLSGFISGFDVVGAIEAMKFELVSDCKKS